MPVSVCSNSKSKMDGNGDELYHKTLISLRMYKKRTLRKMNEVDRTGEGITSLLYVHTFLSFVSAELSKKKK